MRSSARVVTVLALASACGDNGRRAADAMPADTDGRELVRLTYLPPLAEQQRDGLAVIFQAADSTVISVTRTTGDGTANAFVDGDTYVTLIAPVNPLTNRQSVWTYEGVQPGDELVLDTSIQPPADRIPIRLIVPASASAVYYQMVTRCDTQQFDGGAVAGVQFRDCDSGTADILVQTYDAIEHTEADLDQYMLRLDVPVTSSGMVTFPDTYQPIESSTVLLSNLPDSAAAQGTMTQWLLGRTDPILGQFRLLDPVAGQASVSFRLPLPADTRFATDIQLGDGSRVLTWQPATPLTLIDVADYQLPHAIDTPRFEPTSHQVLWSEAPGANVANAALAMLTANEAPIDWTMFSRRSTPRLLFPVLPPSELDGGLTFHVEQLTSLEIRADFDSARQTLLGRSPGRPFPIVGSNGSVGSEQHLP